jgi:hypothetical protein
MPSELYEKIVSERGSLENLIAKIPGFKGYHEKNARREADRLLRNHISDEVDRVVKAFIRVESKILDAGGMKHMTRTREVKAKLQSYSERIQTANPKYSGMFAEVKIGNDELDRIYAFDEAQLRYVDQMGKAVDALETAVKSEKDFDKQLDAVYEIATDAHDAFDLRDDVILEIGEGK